MTERHGARDRQRLTATVADIDVVRQRALLVSLIGPKGDRQSAETSLEEMQRLADTAGSDVVATEIQQRGRIDPATYLGKGKLAGLVSLATAEDVDVVIVDGVLSPVQQRNLQEAFECDVVDRIALILDIFALHANSREGMAQVELAMLRYRLPRLRGRGITMSRLGGGIGTRGPGETQLETDRRRILGRIAGLERRLVKMEISRKTRRKARWRSTEPSIALVGYTNSGKSSLLNAITGADVLVEDRLFSTLDVTSRKVSLPSGRRAVLSDTVGLVADLPHQLVDAFRSTLEEAIDTDLLVHVVDAATGDAERQIASVRETLDRIGATGIPEVLALNKADVASQHDLARLRARHDQAAVVSAVEGTGLGDLLALVDATLAPPTVDLEMLVPYDRGDVVARVHRIADVLSEAHEAEGTRIKARVPQDGADTLEPFAV